MAGKKNNGKKAKKGQPLEADLSLYQSRMERPIRFKIQEFQREDRLKHAIFSD
jgi:hypothetical protein